MTYESRIPLKSSILKIGQSPCERYYCVFAQRCKTESLACWSFSNWADGKKCLPPTVPTKATYDRIFREDDLPAGGPTGFAHDKREAINFATV